MRARALALWPKKIKKEPIRTELKADEWVQEDEVQKLRIQQTTNVDARERLQQLALGIELKRLVL